MLRDEVVDAVHEGRFHVWTARTVDEALDLLTAGASAEGKLALAVGTRLAAYGEALRAARLRRAALVT